MHICFDIQDERTKPETERSARKQNRKSLDGPAECLFGPPGGQDLVLPLTLTISSLSLGLTGQ